ncbi:armadillo-type protein [Mycena galericulata]|nr:armadillo-type protein [Mycena galericulata]
MAVREVSRISRKLWWSDSNPGLQGATINLHTLAKPLMKLMYHRQALGFNRRNGDIPLSNKMLEIYSTYLLCKYVSPSTQGDILEHLTQRAESEDDAHAIVNSPILVQIPHLLDSASRWVRVTAALAIVAKWPDGAQAIIHANTLPHLSETFESVSKWEIRANTCIVVRNLTRHKSSLAAILAANPFKTLVSLLRDADSAVIQEATYALMGLAYWADGAQAIINANPLENLLELLESASNEIQQCACDLIVNLAHHESTLAAMLTTSPHSGIIQCATAALSEVDSGADGAQAAIIANTVSHLSELLGLRELI